MARMRRMTRMTKRKYLVRLRLHVACLLQLNLHVHLLRLLKKKTAKKKEEAMTWVVDQQFQYQDGVSFQ